MFFYNKGVASILNEGVCTLIANEKLANDCARISAVIIYKKHLELVFLLSFLIFFFLLGKSLGTLSHHPLSFLSCFKDFLADLWIMSEYFVKVLFG